MVEEIIDLFYQRFYDEIVLAFITGVKLWKSGFFSSQFEGSIALTQSSVNVNR